MLNDVKSNKLLIPKKKDDSEYDLEDLNHEQRIVVICALEAMMKFLHNDPTYKPLHATIIGFGGTEKSFIINTLISLIQKYTKMNDIVCVASPSGGAAYNVGGCTLHRCLNLQVDAKELSTPLKDEKQDELKEKLQHLLMLGIDERNMISSGLLDAAEKNIRQCVYGGQNQTELWGGVPIILLFGDDYQLFPVTEEGSINGYSKRQQKWNQTSTTKKPASTVD